MTEEIALEGLAKQREQSRLRTSRYRERVKSDPEKLAKQKEEQRRYHQAYKDRAYADPDLYKRFRERNRAWMRKKRGSHSRSTDLWPAEFVPRCEGGWLLLRVRAAVAGTGSDRDDIVSEALLLLLEAQASDVREAVALTRKRHFRQFGW